MRFVPTYHKTQNWRGWSVKPVALDFRRWLFFIPIFLGGKVRFRAEISRVDDKAKLIDGLTVWERTQSDGAYRAILDINLENTSETQEFTIDEAAHFLTRKGEAAYALGFTNFVAGGVPLVTAGVYDRDAIIISVFLILLGFILGKL